MKRSVLAALLLGCASSFALNATTGVQAAELRVKGVVMPDACVPAFSNGGVVDYGRVAIGASGAATVLNKKTVSLSVSCSLPSRVAIRMIDNHARNNGAASVSMQTVALRRADTQHLFGLAAQNGTTAGGYAVSLEPVRNSGSTPALLEAVTEGSTTHWTSISNSAIRKNTLYSWDQVQKNQPGYTSNFQATLAVQVIVEGSTPPSLSAAAARNHEDGTLSGSATVELLYL